MPGHLKRNGVRALLRSTSVGCLLIPALLAGPAVTQAQAINPQTQSLNPPGGRLYITGKYLYAAASCDGVQVLDISDPVRPRWLGGWSHPDRWCARSVYAAGPYVYVASYFAGLEILDVRDPRTPFSVGRIATGGATSGVHVAGRYAYLADGSAGLQVVDVSNPTQPVHIGGAPTSFHAQVVQAAGNSAYVGCGPEGLQIFDLTTPAKPMLVSKCCTYPIGCHTVQVVGTKGYIASFSSEKLCVLDLSDRDKPTVLGTCELGGPSEGICVDGQQVFASTFMRKSGLRIVDSRQPERPKIRGTCPTSDWIWEVRVSGVYAYLMDRNYNIRVIDVSDTINPREVGFFSRNGYVSRPLALRPTTGSLPGSPSGLPLVARGETPRAVDSLPPGGISDAPPELLAPRRAADGRFLFTLAGVPQAGYVVYASADFVHWSPISTNELPSSGMVEVTDSSAGQFVQRYYRAVKQ